MFEKFKYDASSEVLAGTVGFFLAMTVFSIWQTEKLFDPVTPYVAGFFCLMELVVFYLALKDKETKLNGVIDKRFFENESKT